jgi:hypothetical protein
MQNNRSTAPAAHRPHDCLTAALGGCPDFGEGTIAVTTEPAGNAQHVATEAASHAYYALENALVKLAIAGGAGIREREAFPGSIATIRYAEPLAGIRAAVTLVNTASRLRREYIAAARQEGSDWAAIGDALGLHGTADGERRTGYDLAVAAYEFAAGQPDLWRQPAFSYRCGTCGEFITDRGPYESYPDDNESGHAADCSRHAAAIAAWQAGRDDDR